MIYQIEKLLKEQRRQDRRGRQGGRSRPPSRRSSEAPAGDDVASHPPGDRGPGAGVARHGPAPVQAGRPGRPAGPARRPAQRRDGDGKGGKDDVIDAEFEVKK